MYAYNSWGALNTITTQAAGENGVMKTIQVDTFAQLDHHYDAIQSTKFMLTNVSTEYTYNDGRLERTEKFNQGGLKIETSEFESAPGGGERLRQTTDINGIVSRHTYNADSGLLENVIVTNGQAQEIRVDRFSRGKNAAAQIETSFEPMSGKTTTHFYGDGPAWLLTRIVVTNQDGIELKVSEYEQGRSGEARITKETRPLDRQEVNFEYVKDRDVLKTGTTKSLVNDEIIDDQTGVVRVITAGQVLDITLYKEVYGQAQQASRTDLLTGVVTSSEYSVQTGLLSKVTSAREGVDLSIDLYGQGARGDAQRVSSEDLLLSLLTRDFHDAAGNLTKSEKSSRVGGTVPDPITGQSVTYEPEQVISITFYKMAPDGSPLTATVEDKLLNTTQYFNYSAKGDLEYVSTRNSAGTEFKLDKYSKNIDTLARIEQTLDFLLNQKTSYVYNPYGKLVSSLTETEDLTDQHSAANPTRV